MAKFNSLSVGDILSESQYYKVEKKVGDKVQLKVDNGESVVVDSGYVESQLSSAGQFETTVKLTRTEMAELFVSKSRMAMTVMFNKQIKPKEITEAISGIYDKLNLGMTHADFTKRVKGVINLKGEERVMRGRHYGSVDVNGRVTFIDMDADPKNPSRLVDPRTINYLIVENVKYIIK